MFHVFVLRSLLRRYLAVCLSVGLSVGAFVCLSFSVPMRLSVFLDRKCILSVSVDSSDVDLWFG